MVHGSLKAAEGDLELFNREKQQKLNELDVVVPLRLHQVRRDVSLFLGVSIVLPQFLASFPPVLSSPPQNVKEKGGEDLREHVCKKRDCPCSLVHHHMSSCL